MLTQFECVQRKWGGTDRMIDNWLNERQAVLVAFCELARLPPFNKSDGKLPHANDLKRFCQILVDYISAGHFEIFDKLVANNPENVANHPALTANFYPKINKSTDLALKFNDRYAGLDNSTPLQGFNDNLSNLGQILEERFSLEDELIAQLHPKALELQLGDQ